MIATTTSTRSNKKRSRSTPLHTACDANPPTKPKRQLQGTSRPSSSSSATLAMKQLSLLFICLAILSLQVVTAIPFFPSKKIKILTTVSATGAAFSRLPATALFELRRGATSEDNDTNNTEHETIEDTSNEKTADDDDTFYTAVGIQVVDPSRSRSASATTASSDNNAATSTTNSGASDLWRQGSNCVVLLDNGQQQQLHGPAVFPSSDDTINANDKSDRLYDGDTAAVETLAVGCDVIVIVVVVARHEKNSEPLLEPAFVEALVKGLQQRADNNMSSSVVILLTSGDDSSENNTTNNKSVTTTTAIKDRLVLQELSALTPSIVTSLELLSLDDPEESTSGLTSVWKDILQDASSSVSSGSSNDISTTTRHHLMEEAEGLPLLLQGIYKSKGGRDPNKFLVAASSNGDNNDDTSRNKHSSIATSDDDEELAVPDDTNIISSDNNDSSSTTKDDDHLLLPEAVAAVSPPAATRTITPTPTSDTTVVKRRSTNDDAATIRDDEALRAILVSAQGQIRSLETQLEQLWLGFSTSTTADDDNNNDASSSPPKQANDFGTQANMILQGYQAAFQVHNKNNGHQQQHADEASQAQAQRNLWQYVLPPLKQLYDQQLQFLREHYGTEYEQALETATSKITTTSNDEASAEDYQEAWKEAAAATTTAFREAAQAAVPMQCRPGQPLRDANFDYVPALEGLLSDMMVATEHQQDMLGISLDDDDDDEDEDEYVEESTRMGRRKGRKGRKRAAKWYEKVAAKTFVFAVNYAQGWLAYQGIKRAAAQRDAHLPKFPLF